MESTLWPLVELITILLICNIILVKMIIESFFSESLAIVPNQLN